MGLFFLLVWVSVIAALASTERQRARERLLLPGEVDEEFRAALAQGDHAALAGYYRLALSRRPPPRDEQLLRINLACALNGQSDHAAALDELDQVSVRHLSPAQVALWLNNRAYTLTLLGRPDEALDDLRDAEDLLQGDDGLVQDPSLPACISGTRGIALYHKGDLPAAEAALLQALQKEDLGAALHLGPDLDGNPARTAERWWWLSLIARARGDQEEARVRLGRAAAHPRTEFGARAQRTLSGALQERAPAKALS